MKKICIWAILPLFMACNNEDSFNSIDEPEKNEVYNLSITYKGTEYIVPCTTDSLGELVYLDEEFKNFYENEINKNGSVVTTIQDDDHITYYSSEDEMLKELGYKYVDSLCVDSGVVGTRALTEGYAGKLQFWDDSNYKDRTKAIYIDYAKYFCHPRLKDFDNFNDKISALKVWSYIPANTTIYGPVGTDGLGSTISTKPGNNYPTITNAYNSNDLRIVFLGYQHTDYQGSILCCIPDNNGVEHTHNRLRRLGWNDKISSIVLRIATKDLYTCNH